MGFEQRNLENAALRRERGDLGGTVTFAGETEPLPCALGPETSGLQRANNTAGFQFADTRRIIVRTALLAGLARAPRAGDTVTVQGNLEPNAQRLMIAPATGIEAMNGILTAFNLFNPNV